ncbi:hypothetical protein [Lentzea sp. NBRC 105346]|uniref:hypothetical protein n=1 Tax=Lentzea sp. NBRC 105346 TaxID=3032205 RepID=UPI0025551471|nr:hypothetical protein [Lentzea sp. NBRC 105346]
MARSRKSRHKNARHIDDYVEEIVRSAPPFSARQRLRIAAILSSGDDSVPRDGCR